MDISDEDIYRYIVGEVVIGDMYQSPLRKDKNPSFGLFEKVRNGKKMLLWNDFGLANVCGDQAVNLFIEHRTRELRERASQMGIPPGDIREITYEDAWKMIRQEVKPGAWSGTTLSKGFKRKATGEALPYITPSNFEDYHLEYWARFHQDLNDLKREDIESLGKLVYLNRKGKVYSTKKSPAFIYWFGRNPASWKIYRPSETSGKFITHNISGIVEGWNTRPTNKVETVIISASTKDRLCVKKAGFPSLNPIGEGVLSGFSQYYKQVNELADRVVVMYDADDAGYKGSVSLHEMTGWEYVDMRGKLEGLNDFAEFIEEYGVKALKEKITNLCNKM